mgnify:CR=1 FL=1
MWQHFFWFFGHPEVYVLMLPGFGFVSEIIPVFARKVIFGYATLVAAAVSIGAVALSTWAHHMFAVGLGGPVTSFFAASTMLIAVPTGIKIFNWLGTMYGGTLIFKTPMLFCCAFLFQFLCAGLTGVMLSVAPFDWQLTDSYFVVAHFHFVLFGGLLFTIFAAVYYWFPKVTGRMLSERLGRWHFWLFVDRVQPDLRHHAHPGRARDAAPDLHVSGRPRLGDLEPRSPRSACRCRASPSRSSSSTSSSRCGGASGRGRPVGRVDARVGHDVAAAALQLRGRSGDDEPAPALGPEAPR